MNKIKINKNSILLNILKYSFILVAIISVYSQVVFIGSVNAAGTTITNTIKNPIGDKLTDIPSFIHAMVEIVLVVGIPIIALAIIYTGFLFVAAQGNTEKLTKAKNALLYVLIGGALLLGAFVIANAIGTTVEEIKNN